MLFRVAKTLSKTVAEVKYTMSAKELSRWALYFRHEPTNSVEVQIAYLTYMASSFMGNKGKKVEDFIITSFRPEVKKEETTVTSDMLLRAWGLSEES